MRQVFSLRDLRACSFSSRIGVMDSPSGVDMLALLDQLPAVVWATDHDLRITYGRGAALKHLGLHADDLVGASVTDYAGTGEAGARSVVAHRAAIDGTSTTWEDEWRGRTFHVHVEPRWHGSAISGTIGVALDVTERVRLEAELRTQVHTQVLETVARLATATAHEINNPLMVILAQVEMLAASVRPEELHRIDSCRVAIERMSAIVHSMSRLTRLEAATGWPPDLPAMLDLRRSAQPLD
jgi:PAS domain S-box-containing protein